MTTRNVCPALLVSIGVLLGAVQATAEDCATGTPSPVTHRVAIAPEAPRFGSRVDVSIQLKAGERDRRRKLYRSRALAGIAETGLTMDALQERTAKAFDDTNLS